MTKTRKQKLKALRRKRQARYYFGPPLRRDPGRPHAKLPNKRLRKKKRLGEFAEHTFTVAGLLNRDLTDDEAMLLTYTAAEWGAARDLDIALHGDKRRVEAIVSRLTHNARCLRTGCSKQRRARGTVNAVDRLAVKEFIEHIPGVVTVYASPITDAWWTWADEVSFDDVQHQINIALGAEKDLPRCHPMSYIAATMTARRVCAECGKPITEVGVITPEEFDKQFRLPV